MTTGMAKYCLWYSAIDGDGQILPWINDTTSLLGYKVLIEITIHKGCIVLLKYRFLMAYILYTKLKYFH